MIVWCVPILCETYGRHAHIPTSSLDFIKYITFYRYVCESVLPPVLRHARFSFLWKVCLCVCVRRFRDDVMMESDERRKSECVYFPLLIVLLSETV